MFNTFCSNLLLLLYTQKEHLLYACFSLISLRKLLTIRQIITASLDPERILYKDIYQDHPPALKSRIRRISHDHILAPICCWNPY
jgi:hypothetical protein